MRLVIYPVRDDHRERMAFMPSHNVTLADAAQPVAQPKEAWEAPDVRSLETPDVDGGVENTPETIGGFLS